MLQYRPLPAETALSFAPRFASIFSSCHPEISQPSHPTFSGSSTRAEWPLALRENGLSILVLAVRISLSRQWSLKRCNALRPKRR